MPGFYKTLKTSALIKWARIGKTFLTRRRKLMYVALVFTALAVLLFAHIRRMQPLHSFSLRNIAKINLFGPGFLGQIYRTTYRVRVLTSNSSIAEIVFRSNFDHSPVLDFCPDNDDYFFVLYDCDTILRLVKIDTRHCFQPFTPTSALNWIVGASPFKVEQAGERDWRMCLNGWSVMTSNEFRLHSLPSLDLGIRQLYADRGMLIPRIREQVHCMFDPGCRLYDPGK